MKRLGDLLNRVLVVGLVLVAAAVFLAGREAVSRAADYRAMTAPKSLHQLAMEARPGVDDAGDTRLMVTGAAFFVLLLAGGGGLLFAALGGREFGRVTGRRRRPRRRVAPPGNTAAPAPDLRVLPPAPRAPALPSMTVEEGRYEEQR